MSNFKRSRTCAQKTVAFVAYLETVAEINVQQLAGVPVDEQVGGVPVAEPQHVANHRHDRQ